MQSWGGLFTNSRGAEVHESAACIKRNGKTYGFNHGNEEKMDRLEREASSLKKAV